MSEQQGDVLLQQVANDGEIEVIGGIVTMTGRFGTAAYLSLYGGNKDDDGSDDSALGWWGNIGETEDSRKYRSETQFLLETLPMSSANLKRVEDAAARDLEWFLTESIASSVEVEATIPTLNTIKVVCTILAQGEESTFEFVENWKAAA